MERANQSNWVPGMKDVWHQIGYPSQFDLEGIAENDCALGTMSTSNIYGLSSNRWVPGLCTHKSDRQFKENVSLWLTTSRIKPNQLSLASAIAHLIGVMGPSNSQNLQAMQDLEKDPKQTQLSLLEQCKKLGEILNVHIIILDRLQKTILVNHAPTISSISAAVPPLLPVLCVSYEEKRQYRPIIFTEFKKTATGDEYFNVLNHLPGRVKVNELLDFVPTLIWKPCTIADAGISIQFADLPILNVAERLLAFSLKSPSPAQAFTTTSNTINTLWQTFNPSRFGWKGKLITGVALATSIAALIRLIQSSHKLKRRIRLLGSTKDKKSIKQKYKDTRKLKSIERQIHHRSSTALESLNAIDHIQKDLKKERETILLSLPNTKDTAEAQLEHIKQIDLQLEALHTDEKQIKQIISQIPALKKRHRDHQKWNATTSGSSSSSSSYTSSSSSSSSSLSSGNSDSGSDVDIDRLHHLKDYRINSLTDKPILKDGPTALKIEEQKELRKRRRSSKR